MGQTIRKYDGKLLIQPSKRSVKNFLESIREYVRKNRMTTQDLLIHLLNPRIRGWCQYHRYVCSAKTFSKIRHELWKILWNWAKFRHPTKGSQWVKDKYFVHDGRCDWCFGYVVKALHERGRKLQTIYDPTRIPIRRHIKIKSTCNPYDPVWKNYITRRKIFKELKKFKREGLEQIWLSQKGICPGCCQLIDFKSKWVVLKGVDKGLKETLCHLDCQSRVKKLNGVNP